MSSKKKKVVFARLTPTLKQWVVKTAKKKNTTIQNIVEKVLIDARRAEMR